jgi:acyl dehydratase
MLRAFASAADDREQNFVEEVRNSDGAGDWSVAHGCVLVCLMIPMLRDIYLLEDTGPARVCEIDRLRFLAPVPVDSSVRLAARLKAFDATDANGRLTLQCVMECDAIKEPVLEGEVLYRLTRPSLAADPVAGTHHAA